MSGADKARSVRTGFIGLGNQGTPMARRMVRAGYPLTVWARRREVADAFAESEGAAVTGTVAELGAACDHVGLCVFGDADVFEVCEALIPAMRTGSLLAVHSTIHPDSCKELDKRCAERGIAFLDAPVSGGAQVAEMGQLTLMCGGTAQAFEMARPVFESIGKLIVLLGGAGAGQRAKIVNNALMSANMGLARAAVAAAQSLGLDRAAFAEVINASSGRSLGFQVFANLCTYADFSVGTPPMIKDVGLLMSLLENDANSELLGRAADYFLGPAGAALEAGGDEPVK